MVPLCLAIEPQQSTRPECHAEPVLARRLRAAESSPPSSPGTLATLVLLFAFQGEAILKQPLGIAMLAVLIEVPLMLLVVKVVNGSKGWYESGR